MLTLGLSERKTVAYCDERHKNLELLTLKRKEPKNRQFSLFIALQEYFKKCENLASEN